MNEETIITFGGEIKALGDGKVGGYLVRFTDADTPDLEMDFFSKATDLGVEDGDRIGVYYNHGLDEQFGRKRLSRGTISMKDAGVWIETQLSLRDEYEEAIYRLVQEGKLGWSSGSMPHLVEREPQKNAYYIKRWPIGEASITPTPAAGPLLTQVQPLKSWAEAMASLKALWPKESGEDSASDAQEAESKARRLNLELDLLEL